MKWSAKLFVPFIFIAVSFVTFIAGIRCAIWVGKLTHSGLLGICGPYGQHADLVGNIFLGSFPAAIIAGIIASKVFYHSIVSQTEIQLSEMDSNQ